MDTETLKLLKDFSPVLGAIVIIYLVVKMFLKAFIQKGKMIDDSIKRFVSTLNENNKIIGNHIDHNTDILKKQNETNERLIEMINQMMGYFQCRK